LKEPASRSSTGVTDVSQDEKKHSKKPRKRKVKKVRFRDQAGKGLKIADVYYVEKLRYPGDDSDDEGTLACTCLIV